MERAFAIMYDIGPPPAYDNASNGDSRRFELDFLFTGSLEHHGVDKEVELMHSQLGRDGNFKERVLRAGSKLVPDNESIAGYARRLHDQYGGETIDKEIAGHITIQRLVFRGDQRPAARQLMEQEKFTLD